VATPASTVEELLDRADAAREAGRGGDAARLYDQVADRCRAVDDLAGWTRAVLGAASVYLFGAEPGKLPAQLYDVLARTTDDPSRARLNAALTRCWAYAGHTERAARFAEAALEHARRVGDPVLLVDCLDAALAAHWGPDELEVRRQLAARLDEVAAHVLEPGARLQAHLWSLQVACEVLDVPAVHRQLRALELLGEESPRALFFAASRRAMLELLHGRTGSVHRLQDVAGEAAKQASLADAWMVVKAMGFYAAAASGDTAGAAAGAAECEEFALAQGITGVVAEAAWLWTCAGDARRAQALVHTFHGEVLDDLPRDVNWLLTLQCVLEAALFVADMDVVTRAARLLEPYAGRAVFNAGAVMFHGVTDDTLARSAALLGDGDTAVRLRDRALTTYERLGAPWWRDRLASWTPPEAEAAPDRGNRRVHLHPAPGGLWMVGAEGSATPLRELRGFGYLRELVRRPGSPIAALDLVGAGTGVVVESGLGELADGQALAAYRHRLGELEREIAEAEEWSDPGRLDAATAERDALLDELARTTGLGGRARVTGSSQERARVAVRKAIIAAVDRIGLVDETLATHLRQTVHTGLSCSYDPDSRDDPDWVLG
jgi:hypothetical protein